MTSSSTGWPNTGIGELRRCGERLELVAEVRAEEVVHRGEHLGARTVVQRERKKLRRALAPFAEHPHVGVAEAVDGLELVADIEHLGATAGEKVDELALEAVRVLELVHHDRAEAERLAIADVRVVAQQVACVQLEILEVERRLARLLGRVRVREALEQLLQQVAVAPRRLVEGRLLDGLARLLVHDAAVAAHLEAREVEQPVGPLVAPEQLEQLRRRVAPERRSRIAQLGDALLQLGAVAHAELERAARRAKRLVHPREHAAEPRRAVGGEELQPLRLRARAELRERALERLAAQHRPLCVVELAEARIEAGRERVCLQQPEAEAVDGRDPRAVELACEVVPAARCQLGADARAQLSRSAPRIRDDEDRVDVEAVVAHRAREALDEHGGLAGARTGGDEDLAGGLDRGQLLLVHARSTRHMGHRSHHGGQSPPRGSCSTSPVRMRPASRRAVSSAFPIAVQNASSSR